MLIEPDLSSLWIERPGGDSRELENPCLFKAGQGLLLLTGCGPARSSF